LDSQKIVKCYTNFNPEIWRLPTWKAQVILRNNCARNGKKRLSYTQTIPSMIVYDHILYLLYKLLKSIEAGFSDQTDHKRAFETSLMMSLLGLLNVMSAFPSLGPDRLWFIPIVLFFVNYFYFCYRNRFIKIIKKVEENNSQILRWIAVAYLILTVVFLVATR
jgi:hypothetical protein